MQIELTKPNERALKKAVAKAKPKRSITQEANFAIEKHLKRVRYSDNGK